MKIHSLLNPCRGDEGNGHRSSTSPTPAPTPRPVAPYASVPKRQKIPKDAPVFSEGTKVVGHVNYPPYEGDEDGTLLLQHRRFQLFPMREIKKKGVRHIPYNSDKKDFLYKTGREAFEMFQYIYKVPGEDKEYVVVWDYNVGLVRMTPFFKSLKHSKTVPAKALRENAGLKDISYSITGGALVCQGYWMPYQAAKAIAATFCWHIRWVLTPVFGYDFPETCLQPDDPGYGKFLIAPEIVQGCADETNRFRQEGYDYQISDPLGVATLQTPQLPTLNTPWEPMSHRPRKSEESGYYTGGDQNERSTISPQVSPRGSAWISAWTSINGSKSPSSSPIVHSPTFDRVASELPSLHQHLREHGVPLHRQPTSVQRGHYHEHLSAKRPHSEINVYDCRVKNSNPPHNLTSRPEVIGSTAVSDIRNRDRTKKELEAAKIILQLSAADQDLPDTKRTRRGSQY
ncbi:uncharacterized protein CC84DRAFT_1225918 [Paraphaeosphaeria sporulosa]|uniref:HTH APSES-type domain-containing protein n=1 Tax=Paraphaeosphaeria sporulosa TaxID=1460663 RepID=A0A177CWU3_9PLEO|nr:uncharacterized protein CC84DRAFT_1225918 [Paraphaeosphaeria sporulosa]OAG12034.1 hypothetical protein CC84DRAFT_1225918 [Paraphaeosphaeria sporulosa]